MNKTVLRSVSFLAVTIILMGLLAGCGATPPPTKGPPTATPVPPTATPVPPTPTPVPPTATPVPPTATKAPVAAATAAPATPTTAAAMGMGNASASDRELVGTALANMAKAGSFAMKMKIEGTNATIPFAGDIVMEMATVPTQSMHIKVMDQLEVISIGQDSYIKMGTGPWQKSTTGASQFQGLASSFDFSKQVKPEDLAKTQIDKVGSEQIGGVQADVFSMVVPGATPQTVKVWISKQDKTLLQMVIQDKTSTITGTFSDWGKVKIEAPKM